MKANKRMGIVKINRDQGIVDEVDTFEAIFGLGDQFAPVGALWLRNIDGDDTSSRRILIGAKETAFADIVDKGVVGVEIVEQFHHAVPGRLKILIENAVASVSALPDGNNQVAAIICNAAVEAPFFLVGTIIDEDVPILICAETMEVKFVVIIHALERELLPQTLLPS